MNAADWAYWGLIPDHEPTVAAYERLLPAIEAAATGKEAGSGQWVAPLDRLRYGLAALSAGLWSADQVEAHWPRDLSCELVEFRAELQALEHPDPPPADWAQHLDHPLDRPLIWKPFLDRIQTELNLKRSPPPA